MHWLALTLIGIVFLEKTLTMPGEQPTEGKMSFSMKELTEEEAHSPHMPEALRCDACMVLSYVIATKFDAIHEKIPSKKNKIPESELIDILEEICNDKWEGVGIKEVEGVMRISGPGLETANVPGMLQGGGVWPPRFNSLCKTFVGEIGEFELYEAYCNSPEDFNVFLCQESYGYCKKEHTKIEL